MTIVVNVQVVSRVSKIFAAKLALLFFFFILRIEASRSANFAKKSIKRCFLRIIPSSLAELAYIKNKAALHSFKDIYINISVKHTIQFEKLNW